MDLVVNGVEDNIDLFARFIVNIYKNILSFEAYNYNFTKIDEYINSLNIKTVKRPLSSRSILLAATNLLTINKARDTFIISINPNIIIPDTTIKYVSLLKLINYGNMELKGCFIFTKAKQYIEKNIAYYYNEFKENNQ